VSPRRGACYTPFNAPPPGARQGEKMTTGQRLAVVVVAALLAGWGCAAQKDPRTEAIRAYIREVNHDAKPAGHLQVSTTDVASDGRIAKVRGQVQNKFDQPVAGVRYVVTIYSDGAPPKVLDRWQREVDTTIGPGERKGMSLDVESMYFGRSGSTRFRIDAQPVKLGDQDVPPPEGWVGR
jgi:hypothetical protein